jgi:FKBP-type peptidyl-prolyl cis-trans isomerase 2
LRLLAAAAATACSKKFFSKGMVEMIEYGTTVKVNYKGYLDDGSVFDTTEGIEPLEYQVGSGRVIHGFDETVRTMSQGEQRTVHIPAREAFGERSDRRVQQTPMYTLMPFAKDLEVGKTFYFIPQGLEQQMIVPAVITSIDEGIATVDFNHPLAGKDLNFDIELVEVA